MEERRQARRVEVEAAASATRCLSRALRASAAAARWSREPPLVVPEFMGNCAAPAVQRRTCKCAAVQAAKVGLIEIDRELRGSGCRSRGARVRTLGSIQLQHS